MKIGDRVRYIGENWPDRKGWEGTVLDASSAECATVRFDLLPSAFIRVYYSSLELTKMKPASYPFLAIARKYGLDYGDVLLYAEFDRIQISLGFERAQVTNRYANAINKIRTNSDYDIIDREILLSNDQFRAIQRGEIDWLSGGRITAHDELDFTEELPIGALNYVLFDKSLDDGTNDMSNREIDLNDESDGIPGDNI